jgi:RNA recognition motif-containing protein
MAREAREEMNKFLMKGRELEVVYAQEKRKTPNEMRGRVVDSKSRSGGGSGGGGGGGRGGDDFQR